MSPLSSRTARPLCCDGDCPSRDTSINLMTVLSQADDNLDGPSEPLPPWQCTMLCMWRSTEHGSLLRTLLPLASPPASPSTSLHLHILEKPVTIIQYLF